MEGGVLHMQLFRQTLVLPVLNIMALINKCQLSRLDVFVIQGCYTALIVR